MGFTPAGWPQDAQEVMRSPQALATYLTLKVRHTSEAFASYQTMLDRLWKERVLEHDEGGRRSLFATEIANLMADEESLWLATATIRREHSRISMLSSPRGSSPEWTGGWDSRTRRCSTTRSLETSLANRGD